MIHGQWVMDETVNDSSENLNQSYIDISICVLRIFIEIQKFEF